MCRSGESLLQMISLLLFPHYYLICIFTYFNKLGKKNAGFSQLFNVYAAAHFSLGHGKCFSP